jgi:hypothetical protein
MKVLILILPLIVEIAFVAGLRTQTANSLVALSPQQRAIEIRALRQERDAINARLAALEASHGFVPRGLGAEASVQPPLSPASTTVATRNPTARPRTCGTGKTATCVIHSERAHA